MERSDARAVVESRRADAIGAGLTRDDRAGLLRFMLMMRASEERALTLYKQGKVPGSFYDGRGQEAISVGAAWALGPRDRLCILHRDLGAHFVRGVTPDRYLGNYMGRAGGVTGGKDGNMHFGDHRLGCVGMVSMLPDMALVASGIAAAASTDSTGAGGSAPPPYVRTGTESIAAGRGFKRGRSWSDKTLSASRGDQRSDLAANLRRPQ